jgi:NAD(P)H-dependent FMN reductase
MPDPVHVLTICGSVRRPSFTHALTVAVEHALALHGAMIEPWDLAVTPLPVADPAFHHDPTSHTNDLTRRFAHLAQDADAFVLASPIYHNSYSGVLKNALDALAIPQFRYKPVGLLGHGAHGNTQAVDHLRIVVRGMLGIAIPTQICTGEEDFAEPTSKAPELTSSRIAARIERFASELLMLAIVFRGLRRT